MKLIVSTAGGGKTRMIAQKAIEIAKDNKPVIILTDEYFPFTQYRSLLQNSSAIVRQVYSMGDLIKAIAFTPTHYAGIFIDASFMRDFRMHSVYHNTKGYVGTEVFITMQLNRAEGSVDAHIIDYDPTKYDERGLDISDGN